MLAIGKIIVFSIVLGFTMLLAMAVCAAVDRHVEAKRRRQRRVRRWLAARESNTESRRHEDDA